MKKYIYKILTLLMVSSVCFPFSALAYVDNGVGISNPSLSYEGYRLFASGKAVAYASGSYVDTLRCTVYVTNVNTGKVIINETSTAVPGSNSVLATASANTGNGYYKNHIFAVNFVKGNSTPGTSSYDVYLNTNNSLRALSTAEIEKVLSSSKEELKKERDNLFTSFGHNVNDFSFYLDDELSNELFLYDYISIRDNLMLVPGDSVPGYYLNDTNNTLIAVKEDSEGTRYQYIFGKSASDTWDYLGNKNCMSACLEKAPTYLS